MIKLYWGGGDSNFNNFGDELSVYIIRKLSGEKVVFSKPTLKGQIKTTFFSILNFNKNTTLTLKAWFKPHAPVILSIGSILEVSNKNCIVWGSGYMRKEHRAKGGKILAVRGKYTANNLEIQGFEKPEILGDPALLLPLIFKKPKTNNHKIVIGIMPHFTEYEYFKKKYGNIYKVFNVNSNDVEKTIEEIVGCDYFLSTSLHGLIVAHAYNIPAIWIEKNILEPDRFKFKDYFSSVNIEEYNGYTQLDDILKCEESIVEFFSLHKNISKINNSIIKIQKELLSVAPFKLFKYYETLLM